MDRPAQAVPGDTLVAQLLRATDPEAGIRLLDRREQPTFHPWSAILEGARRVAGGLAALGLERGQRVALIYPTCREFFDAFFGVQLAGGVPVPLYPPVRLGRLDEYHRRTAAMLQAASARLVLADRAVQSLLGPSIEAAAPRWGCRRLSELPDGPCPEPSTTPGDLALVQFSSGTTVDPKPVALSHRAVVAHVAALNSFWPKDSKPTGVSWLPLYHDMGLIGCIFTALEVPSTITLIGPEVFVARPAIWLRAISAWRAPISVAPNFAFGLCVDKIRDEELAGVDLSPWRIALNGAEPISPDVLRAFQRRFAPWGFRPEALTPVYGLSEATLAVSFSALDQPFRALRFDRAALAEDLAREVAAGGVELVSVGQPPPGHELRIVDAEHRPLAEDRVGRIETRGPSLMDGYLDRPEATAAALRDGWLDTGDLGFLHAGELYLAGRVKDVLILRGRNYAPADVEQALDRVDGVRKGCAVAVSHRPEGAPGEELMVFAETRTEVRAESGGIERAVVEAVLGTTGLRPERVVLLPPGTLPRTSSGKLRRAEALRLWLAGELTPPAKFNAFSLAAAWGRSLLAYGRARRARRKRPADG